MTHDKWNGIEHWRSDTGETKVLKRKPVPLPCCTINTRVSTWDWTSCKENQRKHLFPVIFSRKSYRLWEKVEKYCRTEQVTDENKAHELCIMGVLGYKHILRICDIYCFSTATMIARTHLNVTLYKNINSPLDATVIILLIISISSTWFGQ